MIVQYVNIDAIRDGEGLLTVVRGSARREFNTISSWYTQVNLFALNVTGPTSKSCK